MKGAGEADNTLSANTPFCNTQFQKNWEGVPYSCGSKMYMFKTNWGFTFHCLTQSQKHSKVVPYDTEFLPEAANNHLATNYKWKNT